MANIATSNMLLPGINTTRLRKSIAAYGLAMPFSLGNLCGCDGMGCHSAPIFALVQSLTVPISRGDPPALE